MVGRLRAMGTGGGRAVAPTGPADRPRGNTVLYSTVIQRPTNQLNFTRFIIVIRVSFTCAETLL